MRKIFTLLFVLVSLVATSQESVLLRINYNKGDKYVMKSELIQDQGLLGGTTINMTSDVKCTQVAGDSLVLETKITAFKMEVYQGQTLAVSYDSRQSEDELDRMEKAMKAQLDPILKSKIITTTSNLGKLLNTKVEPSNPALDQMAPQSSEMQYPEEKVSVGSTWREESDESGLKIIRIYTVDKIDNGTVYISISGNASGIGEGTIEGKTEIDIASGNQNMFELMITLKAQGAEVKVISKITNTKQ